MNHVIIPPPPELAHLVKCFWSFEVSMQYDSHIQVSTFVNDSTGLTFVLDRKNPLYRATIEGYNTAPKVFDPVGGIQVMGVQFYPGSLSRFFGCRADEFTGRDVDLADVVDWDVSETLINTEETGARFGVLISFLKKLLRRNDRHQQWVTELVRNIYVSKGKTTVSQLRKQFGQSERLIERRLLETVGVSARHLITVLRFQESVTMMRNNPRLSLLDIAYSSGFYDQAHFIRDVKRFSGYTPRRLRERLLKIPVNQKGATRYLIDILDSQAENDHPPLTC